MDVTELAQKYIDLDNRLKKVEAYCRHLVKGWNTIKIVNEQIQKENVMKEVSSQHDLPEEQINEDYLLQ